MGPLQGLRIIEIAGVGPGPFAGMLLADMGADVIRVERTSGGVMGLQPAFDFANRNKRAIAVDLKQPAGVEAVKRLLTIADGLLEGFRPGVMEKLGLGPEVCLGINPKLVYGRVTGWGQTGPLAHKAGHDINYIAMAGCLYPIGLRGSKPVMPLNILGDFAGGAQLAAYGMVCALFHAARSGQGQVMDAAMIDGTAQLFATVFAAQQIGFWHDERGTNLLDGGAHFYNVYETADGQYVAVGAIEPPFYAQLLQGLGLTATEIPQWDQPQWPALQQRFQQIFRQRSRADWCEHFAGFDACVSPVLSLAEAMQHADNNSRGMFVAVDGLQHPAPAPRFSATPLSIRHGALANGKDTAAVLAEAGLTVDDIAALHRSGAIACAS